MFKKLIAVLLMLTFVLNSVYGVCFGTEEAEKEWVSFLANGEYWDYMSDEDKQRFREVDLDYAIYDLNSDGCSELLLQDTSEAPFYTTWVFVLQEGRIVLVAKDYGYGMYRYSEKLNLVVGSPETKPFSGWGTCPFYSLKGTELKCVFVLRTEEGKTYYDDDKDKYAISEEERSSYFEGMIYFDFLPVTEISTEEIETFGSEQSDQITETVPPIDEKSHEIMDALNALLVGVGYPSESEESNPAKWSDESVSSAIFGKLLWDYQYTPSSYLLEAGLTYSSPEDDGKWHLSLETIRKITKDSFGRDFPVDTKSELIFVSNGEIVATPLFGESISLKIQNICECNNTVVAVGVAVYNNNANAEFLGHFEAIFRDNPDSVYGYTLTSIKPIEENQTFENIEAMASSVLKERTMTHYATNAIDGNLSTAWVEGVRRVGINEWIQLASADESKLYISAIEFCLGYQKDQKLLRQNGWPCKILIESENGYRQEARFSTYNDTIVLDHPIVSSWIKITILEAQSGSSYDDTCISEIQLHGIDSTTYFQYYLKEKPIEEIDPFQEVWIQQHIDYKDSETIEREIVSGYSGTMSTIYKEAQDDTGVKSYNLAKTASKILDLDFEMSEVQVYELIIWEILYSRMELNTDDEAYSESLRDATMELANGLVSIAKGLDAGGKITKEGLDSIQELYALLKTFDVKSVDFSSTYSQFVKEIEKNIKRPDLIQGIKGDAIFTALGIAVDGLFETYDSLEDILQYMNHYATYKSMSQQLKDAFSRLVVVFYESGYDSFPELGAWDRIINLNTLENAFVSVWASLEEYENEGAAAVATEALARLKNAKHNFDTDALHAISMFGVETIALQVPILKAIVIAKNVLNVGIIFTELLTNVDERAYALDMMNKLYCISVIFDGLVDECAYSMKEDDFYSTLVFDEAVNLYLSAQLLATDFADTYINLVLKNAVAELYEYDNSWHLFNGRDKLVEAVDRYRNSLKMLEEQKDFLRNVSCHDSDLQYNSSTNKIDYNFKDARIFVVACPVEVIVRTADGDEFVRLSGNNDQIPEGYEYYFRVIKMPEHPGEFIKVAVVPEGWKVELDGTGEGVMNAFVTNYTTDTMQKVETYFNIPITADSAGRFELADNDGTNTTLVMDRNSYHNMTEESHLPSSQEAETSEIQDNAGMYTWVWIAIGGTACLGLLLILLLKKRK